MLPVAVNSKYIALYTTPQTLIGETVATTSIIVTELVSIGRNSLVKSVGQENEEHTVQL